jgi:hypothetical protein
MTSLTARTVILRVEQAVNMTASSKTANPNKKAYRVGRDGEPLPLGITPFASGPVLCIRKRQIRISVSSKTVFMAIILTKKRASVYRLWLLDSDLDSLRIQEKIAEKGHL